MCRRASNEGKLHSKTHTLHPSLTLISMILLKHTTSMRSISILPFESTWKPFFRKPAPMTFEDRRMHYPVLSLWEPVSLQHKQQHKKFQGNSFQVHTLHPKLDSPMPRGKWVGKSQHILSAHSQKKTYICLSLLLQSSTFSIISFNHSTYKLFHFTFFFNNSWLPHYIGNNL